jgi:hypothetical protein
MEPLFDVPVYKEWQYEQNSTIGYKYYKTTKFWLDLNEIFEQVDTRHFTGEDDFVRVKSIVIVCDVSLSAGEETEAPIVANKSKFILARNIPSEWTKEQALKSIYFGSPNKDELFKNKQ